MKNNNAAIAMMMNIKALNLFLFLILATCTHWNFRADTVNNITDTPNKTNKYLSDGMNEPSRIIKPQ